MAAVGSLLLLFVLGGVISGNKSLEAWCFEGASGGSECTCGPGCEFCGSLFDDDGPRFHLMDQHGCAENDPNGPVFDPVHGVVHHFYQAHIAIPPGAGPDWGHFVSKDFVRWAALPTAIWNGVDYDGRVTPYDTYAIYSGSAAVIEGAGPNGGRGVVLIYPGLCEEESYAECDTGTLLAQAVPAAYADDPLLTNWTKPSYNPIYNNTQRDPSTPWKTDAGEWRLRTYDSTIYAATDDAALLAGDWYEVGVLEDLRTCECPSLYPLPPLTPGFGASGRLPSWVHKTSCDGDWWQLGDYVAGAPGEIGSFEATPGWEDLFEQRKIDAGDFYASKDFEYPIRDSNATRRINWGWARVPPESAQTLPREITFNPRARTLEQKPILELTDLRRRLEANLSNVLLDDATPLRLGLAKGVAKYSETFLSFDVVNATLLALEVEGCAACTINLTESRDLPVACGAARDVLRLLDDETSVDLRIFVDATFVEAYFQNGRVAITRSCSDPPVSRDADISVAATPVATTDARSPTSVRLRTLHAYSLNSIWVDADTVRAAPRVYW
ncbi:hypothetical protein CTAYLR_003732 [Chrysophaeum taylorii]|uniref:Uncharacterized protein n=1 Tax=Chrysophaeum taylorii TaxID=2483200 RepID=A0AAD7XR58_9STRA|nr:hypothetical protein CTAYLR_003732 [Chrysophaeum taylorii]